tara:strand:- start:8778 stop:8996 length:219 start_codon:yes stop_codon:yes gene_type:complete
MKIGDEVRGVFGAMIPEWCGKIVGMEMMPQGVAVDIEWDNGELTEIMEQDLRDDYYGPTYRKIGYFLYKEND